MIAVAAFKVVIVTASSGSVMSKFCCNLRGAIKLVSHLVKIKVNLTVILLAFYLQQLCRCKSSYVNTLLS